MADDRSAVRKSAKTMRELAEEIGALKTEQDAERRALAAEHAEKLKKLEQRRDEIAASDHKRLLKAAGEAGVTVDLASLDYDKLVAVLKEIGQPFQRAAAAATAASGPAAPTSKKAARNVE